MAFAWSPPRPGSSSAAADLHPALMQLLLQTAQSVHGEAGWFQREREFPRPEAGAWALAATAERHYREGPQWLPCHLR